MDKDRFIRRISERLTDTSFNVQLPNGKVMQVGEREPSFSIHIHDWGTLSAIMHLDELSFAEAYINGKLDIVGELWHVLNCRDFFHDLHPLNYIWHRILPFFKGQLKVNRQAIADHYEYDNDFFLKFMDSSRSYSQALFEQDDETLETAQHRKLDFVVESCNLKPGDRVLDVGGGWGTFVEYAGKKGINVTALTLSRQSERFLGNLIQQQQLPCNVKFIDFYEYQSPEPYDAIVVLGVMEHLPNYRSVLKQFHALLRPGGKIYLDASSFREKYSKPAFISNYVFPGNHRYFCLHDFLTQMAQTNLKLISIHNDCHSYYLTCREWAKRLESEREAITKQWGEKLYRIFHLYLWGSAHAFFNKNLDAYRLVLELPADKNSQKSHLTTNQ